MKGVRRQEGGINHHGAIRTEAGRLTARRATTFDESMLSPQRNMVQLRYASDSKESDWLIRESSIRGGLFGHKSTTPRRLYFKLRGSTLSAHPEVTYPELWRATVKELQTVDETHLTVVLRVDRVVLTLRAETRDVFRKWVDALHRSAGAEFEKFYRRDRSIGKGHFSHVYLATDRGTGDKFAVKIIKRDKNDVERSRKFIRREVKVLSLTDHPNLVKAVDFFSSNGKPHIVLEYVPGGSLRDLIRKHKRLSESEARRIMRGILRGIAYLHAASIVHRDIKPENILMARGIHPKITDFGLATFRNEDRHIHSVVGTPSYVAPEVIRNVPYGPPADVWSCGIMLYFMLSGERPYNGSNREEIKRSVLQGDLKFPSQLFGSCSPEVKHLIVALLDQDQRSRVSADEALKHPWLARTDYEPYGRGHMVWNHHLLLFLSSFFSYISLFCLFHSLLFIFNSSEQTPCWFAVLVVLSEKVHQQDTRFLTDISFLPFLGINLKIFVPIVLPSSPFLATSLSLLFRSTCVHTLGWNIIRFRVHWDANRGLYGVYAFRILWFFLPISFRFCYVNLETPFHISSPFMFLFSFLTSV